MMDEICIDKLEVYAYHGVLPEENEKGQTFWVSAVLHTDTRGAGSQDELQLSTDYGQVCHFIDAWMRNNTYKLLEAVAEHLSQEILLHFPHVWSLDLEIGKPQAPIDLPFGCVSVKVHRGWHRVYLSAGSNMGDREAYLRDGMHALHSHNMMRNIRTSQMIETEPYGGVEQNHFLNCAIVLETLLTPRELLGVLHGIEAAAGRKRVVHWGPRTLDLDIIFYDNLIYEDDALIIPHIDMENRAFVLAPMAELAPNFRHPVLKKTVAQMLQEVSS